MAIDQAMEPYVRAESLSEAEEVLDRLTADGSVPGRILGECYDDLAEVAAHDRNLDAAARLERKAIDAGHADRGLAREMLGWYLIAGGQVDAGETIFREERERRPDDLELVIALGHARSEAGLQDEALDAFDEALTVAKRTGRRDKLDRARVERRAEREHVGLPADEDDLLAPEPGPGWAGSVAWTLAWFPPDQRTAALARWPGLADDFADPVAYARRIEGHLRDVREATGRAPSIAAIDVEALAAWSDAQGCDPDTGAARSRFAAEMARTGGATPWPPARNDPCWCGSGRKYKRCCGAR